MAEAALRTPRLAWPPAAEVRRVVTIAALFIAAYCGLDRLGSVFSVDSPSTPWDLAGGLALALLIAEGPRFAPLVAVADLLSALIAPAPRLELPLAALDALSLAATYGAAAMALRRAGFARIATQAGLLRYTVALGMAAGLRSAITWAAAADWSAPLAPSDLSAFVEQWTGAVVGALVLTPLALALRPRSLRMRPRRIIEAALIGALMVGLMAYSLPPRGDDRFRLFYLLFLPQIWLAVRFGVGGAMLGNLAVQSGLIAYLLVGGENAHMVFNFQFRLLALALSTLFLGVAVSERRRTERVLRERQDALARVSRLSLAGEMAGALAHELNQPLLAMMAFTRTAQRLAGEPSAGERFSSALDGAVAQAERAGAIVKSLRRFVGRSEAERGPHAFEALVREAVALTQPNLQRAAVRVVVASDRALPPAWVDPVQVQQVILNLIQNAAESMQRARSAVKTVTVSARARAEGGLEVEVRDTGPGVSADIEARLFGPLAGDKPDGMGLGLLISRGIVEGHGGRLWLAENRPGACAFRFTLPTQPSQSLRDE